MQLEQLSSLWPELLVNTVGVLLGIGALGIALRQAEPAVNFYIGCGGEEESAQRLVAHLEERTQTSRSQVARSRQIVGALDLTSSGSPVARIPYDIEITL